MKATLDTRDLFVNDYTVLKHCKHGYFLFNRNDQYIGRALDLYGEWCEHEITTLAQLVRPGDIVIDIGANIGTHTIALANMVTSSGAVIAVEAQRLIFNYLVANVAINNFVHVLCVNNA
ncbi:MAG TPA: FkbM family methyltransferase, partial [Terriglobia bacterium]|nr:FkbM family methyltransferase [Terriglobia bacterium]